MVTELSPSDVAELERQKEIALHAHGLARELVELLYKVGTAKTYHDVWLLKGRLTAYVECARDLVHRI